jgi:hypothetical protein
VINSRSGSSAPAGYRFPREVIAVAVRWYLRYGLSYRDVEELLAERDIEVDHVTVYRWVQTFTLEFINSARPARHATGDRWFVDETYVKVAGHWTYLYRATDQHGQVIDVLVSERRDGPAARAVLHPRADLRPVAGRGHHRSGAGLPACDRGALPRPRDMPLSSTRTTAWKLITADSKPGCGRCAD